MIRGVLLDIDGTLIDSNDAHAWAWARAFKEHHISASFVRLRALIGMGSDHVLHKIAGLDKESTAGKTISKRRDEIFRQEFLPLIKPFPKVRELLETLRSQGIRLVAASSASKQDLDALLAKLNISDLLTDQTSSDDADASKPAPDIVEAAIRRIQLPKSELIMIGDTPYDVKAARAAGIGIIAFRCGGWSDVDLQGAIAVYESPKDLLNQLDCSVLSNPSFSNSSEDSHEQSA